jgi:hypothetical protein
MIVRTRISCLLVRAACPAHLNHTIYYGNNTKWRVWIHALTNIRLLCSPQAETSPKQRLSNHLSSSRMFPYAPRTHNKKILQLKNSLCLDSKPETPDYERLLPITTPFFNHDDDIMKVRLHEVRTVWCQTESKYKAIRTYFPICEDNSVRLT